MLLKNLTELLNTRWVLGAYTAEGINPYFAPIGPHLVLNTEPGTPCLIPSTVTPPPSVAPMVPEQLMHPSLQGKFAVTSTPLVVTPVSLDLGRMSDSNRSVILACSHPIIIQLNGLPTLVGAGQPIKLDALSQYWETKLHYFYILGEGTINSVTTELGSKLPLFNANHATFSFAYPPEGAPDPYEFTVSLGNADPVPLNSGISLDAWANTAILEVASSAFSPANVSLVEIGLDPNFFTLLQAQLGVASNDAVIQTLLSVPTLLANVPLVMSEGEGILYRLFLLASDNLLAYDQFYPITLVSSVRINPVFCTSAYLSTREMDAYLRAWIPARMPVAILSATPLTSYPGSIFLVSSGAMGGFGFNYGLVSTGMGLSGLDLNINAGDPSSIAADGASQSS